MRAQLIKGTGITPANIFRAKKKSHFLYITNCHGCLSDVICLLTEEVTIITIFQVKES